MPRFTMTGIGEMRRRIQLFASGLHDQVGEALQAEMEIEKKESMRRTPYLHGFLRNSHYVGPIEVYGQHVRVGLFVGGPPAPYAIYVHEDLEAHHKVGQAKFLESTLRESQPKMAARVASRLGINLEGFLLA